MTESLAFFFLSFFEEAGVTSGSRSLVDARAGEAMEPVFDNPLEMLGGRTDSFISP